MKTKILAIFVVTIISMPSIVIASGGSTQCATNYPVVLAHGMAKTNNMFGLYDYFYQIKPALQDEGAEVYLTSVNSMDSTYNKAVQFRQQFLQVMAVSGADKANIIGHSHGGLYTRYAISNLGIADKVASLTTIAAPHRGSAVADVIVGIAGDVGGWIIGAVTDYIYAFIIGDTNPNSYDNAVQVTRSYMNNTFNPNVPNVSGVYYQSYMTRIKCGDSGLLLTPTWLLLNFYEGQNDGVVSVNSSKWGNFRGTDSGAWWGPGVSHMNQINHPWGYTPGFNPKAAYIDMVADLKNMGF